MRCIIINAKERTITEGDNPAQDKSGLEFMQKTVGGYIQIAAYVKTTKQGNDVLYVDEEGLLKNLGYGFVYHGAHQPFVGNGIICGVEDKDGNTVAAKISLEDVRKRVRFF